MQDRRGPYTQYRLDFADVVLRKVDSLQSFLMASDTLRTSGSLSAAIRAASRTASAAGYCAESLGALVEVGNLDLANHRWVELVVCGNGQAQAQVFLIFHCVYSLSLK